MIRQTSRTTIHWYQSAESRFLQRTCKTPETHPTTHWIADWYHSTATTFCGAESSRKPALVR